MSEPRLGAALLHPALVRHTGYLISRLGFYAAKQFARAAGHASG